MNSVPSARHEGGSMVEKQTDADKAQAMREYREKHEAAMRRIVTLRNARLARDAALSASEKPKTKRRS
jgi:CDP-glycerol glycerophosphotransferase (TagB/SpsB family)